MQIEKRSFNWLPKASAWDLAKAQRAKRKANSDAFLNANDALSVTFASLRENYTMGMAEITARSAAARVAKTA